MPHNRYFVLLCLSSVFNLGGISAFEEIIQGQIHPDAMMGSFVPARSSPSSSSPPLPSFSSTSGVPRVLYSEQAERKYQEIMGDYDMTRRSQVQGFNPGGRSSSTFARQQHKRMPKLVVENVQETSDQGMTDYNDRMMYEKAQMTEENVGDRFRNVEYSVDSTPTRKIPTRNRRIKLGRGHSRLSQAPKITTRTSIHIPETMEPMPKEEMEMMPMTEIKEERPPPNNIQDIIDLQEEVTDEEYYENDAVSRREALKIAPQPLPKPEKYQDNNRYQTNFDSNNNRNIAYRPAPPVVTSSRPIIQQELPKSNILRHAPKLVLLNRGEGDPNVQTQDGDQKKSQSYEFKIEDSNLGIPKAVGGPKTSVSNGSPFTTVEVDSSVPLELSYVMELIREGFFEDEETGESAFSLDAIV